MTTLARDFAEEGRGQGSGALAALLAEVEQDLARGMLSPQVLNDPEVHAAELDRVFTKCWVFVGHVSEIPEAGDYVLRYVGEDQFILVRDEHGEIQLLLNHCMHRASPLCRAEKGNTSHFRCPYHGWIYKNSGEWNGAPRRQQTYRKLDAERWGLRKAPHVDTYHGLIFACLDPDAVTLREYLGGMAWYLDVTFGLSEQGIKVAGDAQRWIVPGNWKSGADNFVGDGWHIVSLHRSVQEIGLTGDVDLAGIIQQTNLVTLDGGHGVLVGARIPGLGVSNHLPTVDSALDLKPLDVDQRRFLEQYSIIGFNVFPNLAMIQMSTPADDGMPVTFISLRQWQPRGSENFELWAWPLVWSGMPDAYNAASQSAAIRNFGAAGLFEQDDTVAWSGGPGAGRSPFARRQMKLNYQMGLDGMSDFDLLPDWPGPGQASRTGFGELNQRRFWQHWRNVLAASEKSR